MNKQLLYLYSCAIHGTEPIADDYNMQAIYTDAVKQAVWHIIYPVAQKVAQIPEQLKAKNRLDLMHEVYRTNFVHNTIAELEKAGVTCIVLKGETLKSLYHRPETRLSGDTDLYIGEDSLKTAIEVMERLGYEVEPYQNGGWNHHRVCAHKVGGVVELHTSLYDDDYEKIWFDGVRIDLSNVIKLKCEDGFEINALPYDDGLLFTAIHLIKHFLGKGIGIRHFSDVLLYIAKYKNEIDFERFVKMLKDNSFYKLFNMCVKIGIKYLGFKQEDFADYFDVAISEKDVQSIDRIMDDVFNGGAFGGGNEAEFIAILNRQKLGDKYDDYSKKKKMVRFFSLFSYGYMLSSYSWLKKYPFLLPVAWIKKICLYVFKRDKSVAVAVAGNEVHTNDKIDERIQLMKDLDIL